MSQGMSLKLSESQCMPYEYGTRVLQICVGTCEDSHVDRGISVIVKYSFVRKVIWKNLNRRDR